MLEVKLSKVGIGSEANMAVLQIQLLAVTLYIATTKGSRMDMCARGMCSQELQFFFFTIA